ncbi:UNKNOWN [Stylonychia lemnae]|uniref:PID domain-containing protein n=1 Tax=Stylonychia lemnae TaxID=5949 RepID=A0A077ZP70_STYLE|nr:UNKNOWN [Stylonychia lemnae]|eukprot:CDW71185.1 UNKNOWN [Stylonychia lemnae]
MQQDSNNMQQIQNYQNTNHLLSPKASKQVDIQFYATYDGLSDDINSSLGRQSSLSNQASLKTVQFHPSHANVNAASHEYLTFDKHHQPRLSHQQNQIMMLDLKNFQTQNYQYQNLNSYPRQNSQVQNNQGGGNASMVSQRNTTESMSEKNSPSGKNYKQNNQLGFKIQNMKETFQQQQPHLSQQQQVSSNFQQQPHILANVNHHLNSNPYQRPNLQTSIQQIIMEEDAISPLSRGVTPYTNNSDQKQNKNLTKIANFYSQTQQNQPNHSSQQHLQHQQQLLIRKNNFTSSPNQSLQMHQDDLTMANTTSGRHTVNTMHQRKNSSSNFSHSNGGNVKDSLMTHTVDGKQLPPLDPKSSQGSFHNQIHSRQINKKRLSTQNIDSNALGEQASPSKLLKYPKQQSHKDIIRPSSQLQDSSNFQSLGQGYNSINNPGSSLDRKQSQLVEQKKQKSFTKQNLNNILQEQQIGNLKQQSSNQKKAPAHRQSPYSINQTAELMHINDKRAGGNSQNSRQKKLKNVIQSYSSTNNTNQQIQQMNVPRFSNPSRFDLSSSPMSMNGPESSHYNAAGYQTLLGYGAGEDLSKRIATQQASTYSPSAFSMYPKSINNQNEQLVSQQQQNNSNIRKQFSQTQMRTMSQNGQGTNHNGQGIQNLRQSKIDPVTRGNSQQHLTNSINKYLGKKKIHKTKHQKDGLKLNLSNILLNQRQNESNDTTAYDQALTAKSNIQGGQVKVTKAQTTKNGKKLQINVKKIPELKNFKLVQNNLSSQIGPFITTDDRRLVNYKSKNIIQQHQSELISFEFTSARVLPSSKNDQLSLGRDFDNNQEILVKTNDYQITDTDDNRSNVKSNQLDFQKPQSQQYFQRKKESQSIYLEDQKFPRVVIDTEMHANEFLLDKELCEIKDKISLDQNVLKVQEVKQTLNAILEKKNLGRLTEIIDQMLNIYQFQIDSQQKFIQQSQSVSPSAYQILKEDNLRQNQKIQDLQNISDHNGEENEKLKKQVFELQQENSSQKFTIEQLIKDKKSERDQKSNEDALKRVTKELGQMYEQNQEQQKEIKKLKKELKESQSREKDYLSVLKNTSEFSKLAIEQQQRVQNIQVLQQNEFVQNSIQQQNNEHKLKVIPKLNLKLAMKNQMSSAVNSSERMGQNLSNQSRHKIQKQYEQNESFKQGGDDDDYNKDEEIDQIGELVKPQNADNNKNQTNKFVPPLKMKTLASNFEKIQEPKMGLDMKKLSKIQDFQDEFMDKYEEFSLSWREAIRREKRF